MKPWYESGIKSLIYSGGILSYQGGHIFTARGLPVTGAVRLSVLSLPFSARAGFLPLRPRRHEGAASTSPRPCSPSSRTILDRPYASLPLLSIGSFHLSAEHHEALHPHDAGGAPRAGEHAVPRAEAPGSVHASPRGCRASSSPAGVHARHGLRAGPRDPKGRGSIPCVSRSSCSSCTATCWG